MGNSQAKIHPTAIIGDDVTLGADVAVGPFSIIHSRSEIGQGCSIGSNCEIGYPTDRAGGSPLIIGAYALIRSHSVIYGGSTFGDRLTTGHHVTIRERTRAGAGLQVGSYSDIQGTCDLGRYVRLHSNVFVSQGSVIEDFAWLFPGVVMTDDPHPPSDRLAPVRVRRFAAIGARSVLLPGITVGEGSLVGAGSVVSRDVRPHMLVLGNPARERGPVSKIMLPGNAEMPAYPWPRHFRRGYPDEASEEMREFVRSLE